MNEPESLTTGLSALASGSISAIIGGISGAVAANLYLKKAGERNNAIAINESYTSTYLLLIGNVQGTLVEAVNSSPSPIQLNEILKLGAWFDHVATLILEKHADKNLLKDVMQQMRDFWFDIQNSSLKNQINPNSWGSIKKLVTKGK